MIYLDNNGTTMMTDMTIKEINRWMNTGNPSGSYATGARELIRRLKNRVLELCHSPDYVTILMSSGSEANATFIYNLSKLGKCSIIVSPIEHSNVLETLKQYPNLTPIFVPVTETGHILAKDIKKLIRSDTKAIICMHANNETGAINDIYEIGHLAKTYHLFFHCDIVQTFCKIPMDLENSGISSFSISFHKIHGPPGLGALVLHKRLSMAPMIGGTQNGGLRGGTENILGIAGSLHALSEWNPSLIKEVYQREELLKRYLLKILSANFILRPAWESPLYGRLCLYVFYAPNIYLPGTLLMSTSDGKRSICNKRMKSRLDAEGIIVSIGSACHVSKKEASHVLIAMNVPEYIINGIIRISMSRDTKKKDIEKFAQVYVAEVLEQFRT